MSCYYHSLLKVSTEIHCTQRNKWNCYENYYCSLVPTRHSEHDIIVGNTILIVHITLSYTSLLVNTTDCVLEQARCWMTRACYLVAPIVVVSNDLMAASVFFLNQCLSARHKLLLYEICPDRNLTGQSNKSKAYQSRESWHVTHLMSTGTPKLPLSLIVLLTTAMAISAT